MTRLRAYLQKPGWNVVSLAIYAFVCGMMINGIVKDGPGMYGNFVTIVISIGIVYFLGLMCWETISPSKTSKVQTKYSRIIEDRLDELERLKRRDMVTPEEYAAKRQEILKDL